MEVGVAAGKEQRGRAAGARPEGGGDVQPHPPTGVLGQQGAQGTCLPLLPRAHCGGFSQTGWVPLSLRGPS